jgi:hypothetical protein
MSVVTSTLDRTHEEAELRTLIREYARTQDGYDARHRNSSIWTKPAKGNARMGGTDAGGVAWNWNSRKFAPSAPVQHL